MPLLLLCLALLLPGVPAWGDPPPPSVTPADVREIHDLGDFEGLFRIVSVQVRDRSADAINRYRVFRLTPEFATRLDALLDGTAPTPGLTEWLGDFRDTVSPIVRNAYDWAELRTRMYDLRARYAALKIPAS